MKKTVFLPLITFLSFSLSFAQNTDSNLKTLSSSYYQLDPKDSSAGLLLREMLRLSLEKKSYDSAAKYAVLFFNHPAPGMNDSQEELGVLSQAASFSERIIDSKLRGTVHLKLAGAHFNLNSFKEALPQYSKAIEIFEPKDSVLIADSYFFRGQAYDSMGYLILAMNDYQTANSYYEALGKKDFQSFTLGGIAILYSKFSLYDEAEKIRNQIIAFYKEEGLTMDVGIQQYNQAEDYRKNGNKELEKKLLLELDQLLPLEERYRYFEALVRLKLAVIFAQEGNSERLNYFFEKAETLIAEEPDITADNIIYLAAQYWRTSFQGNLAKATEIAKRMLRISKISKEMDHRLLSYESLIHSFEQMGNFPQAYTYLQEYKNYQDSLFVANRASTFSFYQTQFETEKKERELSQQALEIERIKSDNRARVRILFLIIFVIIVAAVGGFLWKNLRESKKKAAMQSKFAQELLKNQEAERSRISKDLHDGLGQSLLLIKNKVRLNQDLPTGELLDTAISELRSIARSLHPMQLEKLGLEKAIQILLDQIDRETDLFVSAEIEELGKVLDKEVELHIYRIFQETLNNILKHAEASAMKVSLSRKDQLITLSMSDNGKGFDFSEKYNDFKSLGLKTLKERCAAIHGTMKVTSEKGKGTTFSYLVHA